MSKSDLSELRQKLASIAEVISSFSLETRATQRVFVFTSLDLVNSTAFKARSQNWPGVMDRFYQVASHAFLSPKDGQQFDPRVWKYVGDEVLFRTEVASLLEVAEVVKLSASAVVDTHDRMESTDPDERRRSRKLGVKGTCWVAVTNSDSDDGVTARNRIIKTQHVPLPDFLGPDIDTGFRIGKASARRCLVLSVELACLLLDAGPDVISRTQMRLVGHEVLKGVLDGRPYPIVWYREDWTRFSEEFDYDEFLSSQLLQQARDQAEVRQDHLQAIVRQVGIDNEVRNLRKALEEAERRPQLDEATSGRTETHGVAACVHLESRTVMLRRRVAEAEVAPGKWDFGCVSIIGDGAIREELVRRYKEKFGLSIELVDADRSGPLSDFSFPKGDQVVNGLSFGALAADRNVKEPKGREIRWYPLDEPPPPDSVGDAPLIFSSLRKLFPPPTMDIQETGRGNAA